MLWRYLQDVIRLKRIKEGVTENEMLGVVFREDEGLWGKRDKGLRAQRVLRKAGWEGLS